MTEVVVIGAGQAGLAVSRELSLAGVEHVILERGRVGEAWRGRWDSFCLVTPNWSLKLPGDHYDGGNPDGFILRDEIVAYLERYADRYEAPVQSGVDVSSLERANGGGFALATTAGDVQARTVVVTTGAYQRPHRPAAAASLPRGLLQLDIEQYRNPDDLPSGPVLVVGSGQSGCQIAEELHGAGRTVVLSCGRAPWFPRRVGGRDVVWWAAETGFFDVHVRSLPDPRARLTANILATGHDGGHDLHLRTLHRQGVTLVGHFVGVDGNRAQFAADLAESVAWGDERYHELATLFRKFASERGLPEPELDEPEPIPGEAPVEVDLRGFGAVVFAGGFRPDYQSWIRFPEAFDELGFPIQEDGASSVVADLYFAGVHFLRKRKSALFLGVGEDAEIVARKIAAG